MRIRRNITAKSLLRKTEAMFELSAAKIKSIEKSCPPSRGAPVFTVKGKYTARGWTEWTQGFQFGAAILQYDATDQREFLELGKRQTVNYMAPHVSHFGVHDHGFNNISTYGALWRLIREGRIEADAAETDFYELALRISGAVQAARWTPLPDGGYIYSFNGPHSLFVDTIRSLRSLAVAHSLGHVLLGEHDERVSLLDRLLMHGMATAKYSVYYGKGRDSWDVRGRTVHESIFNVNDGNYRCPSSQQGYSPFTTWTRGLAWAITGFAEQLEFLDPGDGIKTRPERDRVPRSILSAFLEAALATADFYIENSCADGVPLWDTGAPNVWRMKDYLSKPSNPYNPWEPVDSSAAAIAAQGFLRLGNYLVTKGDRATGNIYRAAGLSIAETLLDEPYISKNPRHEGLLLHSVYHRPNGWDYIAAGQKVPNGESSMWGDYHLRELGLMILREARGLPYLTFFKGSP
jgi:hypothetical protein